MEITKRQKLILDRVIKEYINNAEPISSQLLEKNYSFDICPATIRIEMQKLTDGGYLLQPHTSAGRVPTDKAYRSFVNNFFEEEFSRFNEDFFDEIEQIEKDLKGSLKFIQILTKRVAELTSGIAISYLSKEGIILKEGWEEILKEPEFKDTDYLAKFMKIMDNIEEDIEEFEIPSEMKVYIGKEIPLSGARDFSLIISPCNFNYNSEGSLAILGPKRMAYSKNIGLIKSITKHFSESK